LEKTLGNVPTQIKFRMYDYWLNSSKVQKETGNYWARKADSTFYPKIFSKFGLNNIRSTVMKYGGGHLDPERG